MNDHTPRRYRGSLLERAAEQFHYAAQAAPVADPAPRAPRMPVAPIQSYVGEGPALRRGQSVAPEAVAAPRREGRQVLAFEHRQPRGGQVPARFGRVQLAPERDVPAIPRAEARRRCADALETDEVAGAADVGKSPRRPADPRDLTGCQPHRKCGRAADLVRQIS